MANSHKLGVESSLVVFLMASSIVEFPTYVCPLVSLLVLHLSSATI
jgi:hypothetical protein